MIDILMLWLGMVIAVYGDNSNSYICYATETNKVPIIDGVIEDIWSSCQPIKEFTQIFPQEGEIISESTTVYLLSDKENLYVAFECHTNNRSPDQRITPRDEGQGDEVAIFLGTFGDKRTAYVFYVSASGIQSDGIYSDDGRSQDLSWDGVWFSKTQVYQNKYTVEIKIPFKSIRYLEGLDEYSVNFSRSIPQNGEVAYWAPMKIHENIRISRFGTLKGITPKVKGKYLEVYPVIFLNHDRTTLPYHTIQDLGLDLQWGITPSSRIQIAANPDFGEVEADPYQVNLSKYTLFYEEKRPFYIEGNEIFSVAGFGQGLTFYEPIILFYSRQIGKKSQESGNIVPISLAGKFINKSEAWETGILLARTEALKEENEPQAYFTILRSTYSVLKNSTLGVLYAGKEREDNLFNRALGSDFTFRSEEMQWQTQLAGADYTGIKDWAFSSGLWVQKPTFILGGSVEFIGDSFDVSEIGYVPWQGSKSVTFLGGPTFYPEYGGLQFVAIWGGITGGEELNEPDWPNWARAFFLFTTIQWRNNWGISADLSGGKDYEFDRFYRYFDYGFSVWSDWSKPIAGNFWINKGYTYNYQRGYFANQLQGGIGWSYSYTSRLQLRGNLMSWIEFKPNGKLEEITDRIRPILSFSLNKDLQFRGYWEGVFPRSYKGRMISSTLGFLLAWNFRPKSWFYLAFNNFEELDQNGKLTPYEQVGLVKLRYLFYF